MKKLIGILISSLLCFACLMGCGKTEADPNLETLNQALEAINQTSSGTLTINYVEQGQEYAAETIQYTLDGGKVTFSREEYETEGDSNLYKYENDILYREMEDNEGKYEMYDSQIRYKTLSDIAGVNLKPLESDKIDSITTEQQGEYVVYTVVIPQDALLLASDDEQTPVVIDALTKRYYLDNQNSLKKVEFDFDSTVEMTLQVEFS